MASNGNGKDAADVDEAAKKRSRMRSEFDALHKEMEIADYGINQKTGRSRRKISRQQSKVRTIKRKVLEVEDAKVSAIPSQTKRIRMRGSRAALEDEVIQGSLIFGGTNHNGDGGDNNDDDSDEDYVDANHDGNGSSDEEMEDFVGNVSMNIGDDDNDDEGRYELYADELNIDIDDDEESNAEDEDQAQTKTSKQPTENSASSSTSAAAEAADMHIAKIKASAYKFSGKKIAKTMYRMKNFKSHKMAQKHGSALGAHARGFNRTAVRQLKDVASAAPIAPQVYSSLGLVYESMLRDEVEKSKEFSERLNSNSNVISVAENEDGNGDNVAANMVVEGQSKNSTDTASDAHQINMKERLKLARKTFGSYHVAAVLCKMDYSLWMRAGDAAMAIANIHSEFLKDDPKLDSVTGSEPSMEVEEEKQEEEKQEGPPDEEDHDSKPTNESNITTIEGYVKYHHSERIRWLEESKNDYQTADNLRPPGITVPAKLAHTQMELGNISEALTILTDLKNKSHKAQSKLIGTNGTRSTCRRQRSELERSFSAWLLYADLMLVIGHECRQWNLGIHTNENYMFRRWLRKYSTSFDWQERRLQALCLALEAAAGTRSCAKIVSWTRIRANEMKMKSSSNLADDNEDPSRWQVCDAYELDRENQKKKLAAAAAAADKNDGGTDEDEQTDKMMGKSDEIVVDLSEEMDSNTTKSVQKPCDSPDSSITFDQKRQELMRSNQLAMATFDKVTADMNLKEGSNTKKKRDDERQLLMKRHRESLVQLVGDHHQQEKLRMQSKSGDSNESKSSVDDVKDLPMSASCATICDIANQLIKLCLAMKLHQGGRLVAEAVSLYLQQRASRHEQRLERQRSFQRRQENLGKSILQLNREIYDDIANIDSDSDEEDVNIVLSDDEDFDSSDGEKMVIMMRKGILTPNLQVLYGLCLISEGNRDFLAEKMIGAIKDIEDSDDEGQNLEATHGPSSNTSSLLFRQAMTSSMNKLDAFAFTSDVIKQLNMEQQWSDRLLPYFQDYLEELDAMKASDILKENSANLSMQRALRRNKYVKVMFSTFRMKIFSGEDSATNACGNERMLKKACDLSYSVIQDIFRFQDALWGTKADGNPTEDTVDVLNILSSAFSLSILCLKQCSAEMKANFLPPLYDKLKLYVSLICKVDIPDNDGISPGTTTMMVETWRDFPVPSNWQSDDNHIILSRTVYNLAVSCNVSSFSGWEKDEFTLKLLKKNRRETFFGVNVDGDIVEGCLDQDNERYLSEQWQIIENIIPTLCNIDFHNAVSIAKTPEWYRNAATIRQEKFQNIPIACYGEDSALNICLIFSYVGLMTTEIEEDEIKIEGILKNAMSIVLPLTQFCLHQNVWDSNLGSKGTHEENSQWMVFHDSSGPNNKMPTPKNTSIHSKTYSKPKDTKQKKKKKRHINKSKTPISKLIQVPADILLREWNGKETFDESDEDEDVIDSRLNKWTDNVSGPAKLAMKKLDYCIRKLRQCSTITALQKASLGVSLALLEVASKKECRSPFLCLNQASIFAAQGPKGGNNDEEFKKALPRSEDCTAEEALQIVGRSDCLRALHFINEAMFLCSYAAKVCCLHRDKMEPDHPWTPKWRIVGIMVYTISVGIDSIIHSLMEGDARNAALESWEKSVRAEIGRGRLDAIAMQKAFGHMFPSTTNVSGRKSSKKMERNGIDLDNDANNQNTDSFEDDDAGSFEDYEEEDLNDNESYDDDDEDDGDDMDVEESNNANGELEMNGTVNPAPPLPETTMGPPPLEPPTDTGMIPNTSGEASDATYNDVPFVAI